jgi:zinc transporter ZupT
VIVGNVGRNASRDIGNRRPTMEGTIGSVFLAAMITALVTGLGAVPFLYVRTTAIAIHNIPDGLAICLVLIPRGTSVTKASLWSIFTSLPQPLCDDRALVVATLPP